MAKTFQFDDFVQQQNPHCLACEEMLLDAADGLLSTSDQAFLDRHLAGCTGCMQRFSDAQRGAAWLAMLKPQRPEPSGDLIGRILAETSGSVVPLVESTHLLPVGSPLFGPQLGQVIPFAPRSAARDLGRFTRFTRLALEPRYAMTAAMAFFSIALTLNLTGVRLDQLHARDLSATNLKRSYFEASASAVRRYDSLRVVRVLESRVDDIRQNNEDRPAPSNPSPEPAKQQPTQQPEQRPEQDPEQRHTEQPVQQQKKSDSPSGPSSRRESPLPTGHLMNASYTGTPEELRRTAQSAAVFAPSRKKEGGLA